jgi:hypothetical protein
MGAQEDGGGGGRRQQQHGSRGEGVCMLFVLASWLGALQRFITSCEGLCLTCMLAASGVIFLQVRGGCKNPA